MSDQRQCDLLKERDWYLNALLEMKRAEIQANPTIRNEEQIRQVVESEETLRDFLNNLMSDESVDG